MLEARQMTACLGIKSNNLVAKPYAIHMSLEVILRVLSGVEVSNSHTQINRR
jgi:hypothetical protein